MDNGTSPAQSDPRLRDLYPKLDAQQLREAEENLDRYLELALQTYERIRNDPDAYARFRALTDSMPAPTMNGKRSNP